MVGYKRVGVISESLGTGAVRGVNRYMVDNGWVDGWMDAWVDWWVDGWMYGWMDGWVN